MKQARVYFRGIRAGILTEDERGYTFQYEGDYLHSHDAEAISLTLPLSEKPYNNKVLFPFLMALFLRAGCWISLKRTGRLTYVTVCPC